MSSTEVPEVVVLRRQDLFELLGEFALAPFASDEDCAPKASAMIERVEALRLHRPPPNLGCATTLDLIRELMARAEVSQTVGEAWPGYSTVNAEVTA